MCELDTAEIQFLVANIRTDEGRKLASEHNVGHVTLLLLDKKGKRRQVLTGMQQSDYLQNVFRSHMARYNNS